MPIISRSTEEEGKIYLFNSH